ncbi:MAG: hypothetical protein EXR43_00445 [Dehalococcoidia bacterium]|nr:hypothetical protein [Dehalococcoidia bacterium]
MTTGATATKTLRTVINHKTAPISTQQLRLSRGIEELYYALLYTGRPAYQNRPQAWSAWLEMGFHIALKSPPPETADSDAAIVSVRSAGKSPEYSLASADGETLQKLETLLKRIDSLRGPVAGRHDDTKAEAVIGEAEVSRQLIKPLTDCLKSNGLRQGEIDSFMFMVRRALLALTHDDITSIQIRLS